MPKMRAPKGLDPDPFAIAPSPMAVPLGMAAHADDLRTMLNTILKEISQFRAGGPKQVGVPRITRQHLTQMRLQPPVEGAKLRDVTTYNRANPAITERVIDNTTYGGSDSRVEALLQQLADSFWPPYKP